MKTSRKVYVLAAFLGLSGLLAAAWSGLRTRTGPGRDPLESAVLAENWREVKTACGSAADAQLAAHLRALKAHACLALNDNDESLGLFLSLANRGDLAAWEAWATKFAEDHRRSPVAVYLKGDALARLGDWAAATKAYTQALSQADTPLVAAMILNARGVALVYCSKPKEALGDMERACMAAPGFADAHASLATLLVLTEAPEGAMEHYDQALSGAGNSFALARNGRGCAMIGFRRDPQTAAVALQDFAAAWKCPQTRILAESNIHAIHDACTQELHGKQKVPSPGTTLVTQDMQFRGMTGLDANNLQKVGAQLSPQQFKQITREYQTHQRNIDMGQTMFTGLDKIGINFNKGGLSAGGEASGQRFEQHLATQKQLNADTFNHIAKSFMSKHDGPGGADTMDVALDKSTGDTGPWLAKNTWFGLVPGTELPPLAPMGF